MLSSMVRKTIIQHLDNPLQGSGFSGDTITLRYTGPVESWRNIVQIVRKEYDLEKYFYFLFLSILA